MNTFEFGIDITRCANFELRIVKTKIGAANRRALDARILHQETGIEADTALVGAFAHQPQRVVAGVDEGLRVLVGAPKDDVVPAVDIVAEKLADLGVVEHGAALAETEGNGLHRRAGEFVDARSVLLAAHGRLVAVDVRVPAVVVEHDSWLRHCFYPLRPRRAPAE